tara:strand:+ start:1259 stop:2887 length:1629 start_codon:yes stop_codon:yes gene_type:complete
MVLKNSLNYINEFFTYISNQLRKIYLNSSIYNKKISNIENNIFNYKPSPSLLSCLIKFSKNKKNIEDFYIDSIWKRDDVNENDYKKLHNFFWLFTLDLKSSKKITQSIILNWIENNQNYNQKNWEIDILSKRIISWISNSKLTYEESTEKYKIKFNFVIKKQVNHLINEIDRSDSIDDKMIGCTAIILSGLSYQDIKTLNYGLELLKKISNYSIDDSGFPKSRSLRQLVFYLKYFILIRELLKESQNNIPDYLNESIFYLGQNYNLIWQSNKLSFLFNGSHEIDYSEFDRYLKLYGYKFKHQNNEAGGYGILQNKNLLLAMDIGSSPDGKFSKSYQSGPLSFEMFYQGQKIITNCGFFQNVKHQLHSISKSTAAHSTLTIDNGSISRFKKSKNGSLIVEKNFKVFNKKILQDKKYLQISAEHDGYLKKYGIIHLRELNFITEANILKGTDILIKKRNFKSTNFEIRFHFHPLAKLTKTIDQKSILVEIENSGWRFTCEDHLIDVETGLYFGKKNTYVENQNIFVSGLTLDNEQKINWQISKI